MDLEERFNECKKNIVENLALCEKLAESRREKMMDMERSSGRIDALTNVHATYIALLAMVNIGLRTEWDATRRHCYEILIPLIDSLRKDAKEKIEQAMWRRSLDETYELQMRMEKVGKLVPNRELFFFFISKNYFIKIIHSNINEDKEGLKN